MVWLVVLQFERLSGEELVQGLVLKPQVYSPVATVLKVTVCSRQHGKILGNRSKVLTITNKLRYCYFRLDCKERMSIRLILPELHPLFASGSGFFGAFESSSYFALSTTQSPHNLILMSPMNPPYVN